MKSFVRKDGADAKKVQEAKNDDPGNPTVNFPREKRCNDEHQSATDAESVLYPKAKGKEAHLCFGGHILMENRHGLCADFAIHNPIAQGEPAIALQQVDEHVRMYRGTQPKTSGSGQRISSNALCLRVPGTEHCASFSVQGWSEGGGAG
jgi:hypothetical protein